MGKNSYCRRFTAYPAEVVPDVEDGGAIVMYEHPMTAVGVVLMSAG